MFFLITISIVILSVLGIAIFINTSPQFGAKKNDKLSSRVLGSSHYKNGAFQNPERTMQMTDFKWSSIPKFFSNAGKKPQMQIPVRKLTFDQSNSSNDSLPKITWFGHSTLLIEMEGKKLLLDPMLGNVPAPVSFFSAKRFNSELPATADELPYLDAVLISHDHYDHLDYGTIQKIKDKTGKFYTPLGVGAHLILWGVEKEKITELDWWEEIRFEGLTFAATPGRHFSGRGLSDRNSTQWCSWVIRSGQTKIFFSGDSGYGKHFKEIGEKYGPFDITLMECGQYNEQWAHIHMMPEESVQAHIDLKGKVMLPIHWGAFSIALHSWTDPIERVVAEAENRGVTLATPQIGEKVILHQSYIPQHPWWEMQPKLVLN